MRLNFKGSGFTAKSGTSLCQTCEHCQYLTGEKLDQTQTICTYSRDFPVTYDIKTCTVYQERGRMSLARMYQEAWELAKDKRTGKIGFYTKEDLNRLDDKVVRQGRDFDPYE